MENIYVGYCTTGIELVRVKATDTEIIEATFLKTNDETSRENQITIEAVKQLDEYFAGNRKDFDLPLRFSGTPFQADCLKAMLKIPYGKTISYKEEAIMIGREKAVRAVGNANRNNKIGIIIPCHRVIGSDGRLVGYAGRIDLKAWLLEHEKKYSL